MLSQPQYLNELLECPNNIHAEAYKYACFILNCGQKGLF
jgi:hypothetical protein